MTDAAEADMLTALFVDALADVDDPVDVLREWSTRYPQLAPEFSAIALEQAFVNADSIDDAAVDRQAMLMQGMLGEAASTFGLVEVLEAGVSTIEDAGDLKSAAAARGIGYPAELASRLRLPIQVVERISARRVEPGTLPVVLIRQISTILVAGRADVVRWLTASASPTPGMAALVHEEPSVYQASTAFVDLVENFADFDEDDRAYWKSVLIFSRKLSETE